ncbi:MAG: Hsp20/alpha crystallin family protein [Candidatus Thiodiazotropha sp. LLP2]
MKRYVPLFGLALGVWLTLPVNGQPYPYPIGGERYSRPPVSSGSGFHTQRSLRFKRDQDESGYHLRIKAQGYTPDAIQVKIVGAYLVVGNQEVHKVENRHQRGYSFSSSSSSMHRRFRLPPDADTAAMTRSENDGVIVITLPYR